MIRQRIPFAAAIAAFSSLLAPAALAAQLAGVNLPDTEKFGSQTLTLNGIGLRTYSMMHVHIYVAGLYLAQPTGNANEILQSSSPKILRMHFVHSVNAAKVRDAWRTGITENCVAPCQVNNAELTQFLNSLQAISAGEDILLVFDGNGLNAYENNQYIGRVTDPQFARLMLAVFIGPNVETPALKSELLGQEAN